MTDHHGRAAAANSAVTMLALVACTIARDYGDLVATAALYTVANARTIEHGGPDIAAAALRKMADRIATDNLQTMGHA